MTDISLYYNGEHIADPTAAEALSFLKKRQHTASAKKGRANGCKFSGKVEARRFNELNKQQHRGQIRCLRLHPQFELPDGRRFEASLVYWQGKQQIIEDYPPDWCKRSLKYAEKVRVIQVSRPDMELRVFL